MEQAVVSVEAEQKRTDDALASRVTKSADHTIGCADLLHLNCCSAFTGRISSIEVFGDNAIKIAAGLLEPFVRNRDLDGIIAKHLDAAYASGERTAAVKVKDRK